MGQCMKPGFEIWVYNYYHHGLGKLNLICLGLCFLKQKLGITLLSELLQLDRMISLCKLSAMSLVTMISNLVQFKHLLSSSYMPGIFLSIMFNGEQQELSNHLSQWFLFRK